MNEQTRMQTDRHFDSPLLCHAQVLVEDPSVCFRKSFVASLPYKCRHHEEDDSDDNDDDKKKQL